MAASRDDVVALGGDLGSVRVRPILPKLLRVLRRRATLRDGKLDLQELMVLKLVHGVVDPSFTEAEARQVTFTFTQAALQPIVDRIDELSGTDEHLRVRVDPRTPPKARTLIRTAAMATAWSRRPTCEGQHRRASRSKPIRRRGSRRTNASASRDGPSSSSDDDGESSAHLSAAPTGRWR